MTAISSSPNYTFYAITKNCTFNINTINTFKLEQKISNQPHIRLEKKINNIDLTQQNTLLNLLYMLSDGMFYSCITIIDEIKIRLYV